MADSVKYSYIRQPLPYNYLIWQLWNLTIHTWQLSVNARYIGEHFRWKFSVKILGEIKILEVKFDPPHKWKFMFQISYK